MASSAIGGWVDVPEESGWIDAPEEKPSLGKQLLQEGIVNPARQIGAGYFRGAQYGAHMLQNLTDIGTKVTGLRQGGAFKEAEEQYRKKADELAGGRKDVASQVYRGIGEAPADVARYMVGTESLGPVAGMAAVSAAGAADKGPREAAMEAAKGAAFGTTGKFLAPATMPVRATGMGVAMAAPAAAEGAPLQDVVAQGLTGAAMGLPGGTGARLSDLRGPIQTKGAIQPPPLTGEQYLQSFAKEPPKAAAQESAEAFAEPTYAELFDQADKQAAKRARTPPEVPESGPDERVQRVQDARERLSLRLIGQPWADVNNSDRLAIDDLVKEDLGFAVQPGEGGWIDVPAERPTAETRTVPEKPETMDAQIQQLQAGQRRVVMIPLGTPRPKVPNGMGQIRVPNVGHFVFDKDTITANEIRKSALNKSGASLTDILGAAEGGMGVPDKADLVPPIQAVVGRGSDGTVVQGTLADQESLPSAVQQTEKVTPPEGKVELATPEQVVQERRQPTSQNAEERILAAVKSMQPSEGVPVTAQRLRTALPDMSREEFDRAALELRKRQQVYLNLHYDPYKLPNDERAPLIEEPSSGEAPSKFYGSVSLREPQEPQPPIQPASGGAPGQNPAPETAPNLFGSERGAIPADPLGVIPFVKEDVLPAAKGATRWIAAAGDSVLKLFSPTSRGTPGGVAALAGGLIRESGANMAQARDQAYNDLKQARKFYQPRSAAQNYATIDAIETGNAAQLPPAEQAFAQTIRQQFDDAWQRLNQKGLLNKYIDDYFPHSYKDPQAAANWLQNWMGKRPMAGSEAYRKARTFPTLREAIDAGLTPKYSNPVDYVLDKLGEVERSIQAHDVIEDLKSQPAPRGSTFTSLLPTFEMGKKPPAGWARIDDRIATGRIAPEPLARVINNHLAPGIQQDPIYRAWRGFNNTMNMLDLSLSYYHGATTTLNSSLSDMALGMKQLVDGHPLDAAASVGRGMVPFASTVRDQLRGTKLKEVWDGERLGTPVEQGIVDALRAGGGRARQDLVYSQKFTEGMLDAFSRGNMLGGALRMPLSLLELSMKPIMEHMVPNAKLGAFANRAEMELERNPALLTADREQAREIFGKIWDSVDNRFGQVVYNNLFMNRMAKDLMMAVVGRPGWNIGTAREIGGGFGDIAGSAVGLLKGERPQLSDRAAYTVALFLGGAVINGVTNALLTGEAPKGIDYLFPRDGNHNDDGTPSRVVLPMYLSKDIYSYVTKPLATLKAKAAPALTVTGDLVQNRDFYNNKIYGEGGMGLGQYAKQTFTPYSIQGMEKNFQQGKPLSKVLLPEIGVMPASASVSQTALQKRMREVQLERQTQGARTRQEAQQHQLRMDILRGIRQNQNMSGVIDTAVQHGMLSHQQVKQLLRNSRMDPDIASFARLDVNQAAEVYALGNPEEKKRLLPAMRQKAARGLANPGGWTPQTRQIVGALGLRTPRAMQQQEALTQ